MKPRAPAQLLIQSALTLWAAAPALAQTGLVPQVQINSTRRIAPGGSDLDPLRANPRVVPTDLRSPIGFENIYQLSTIDRFGKEQTMFARRSGGLTAVFPRSVYVQAKGGLVPEIPAGTVFVIGEDKSLEPGQTNLNRAFNAVSYTAPLVSAQQVQEPPPPVRSSSPRPVPYNESIWKNEEYRQRLIGRLLDSKQ